MKKTLNSVFSFILSLILAFSLLLGGLSVFAYNTALNPEALIRVADESKYTEELYQEIYDSWDNLFAITGVSSPEPMLKVLTFEDVKNDAFSYLRSSYNGKGKISTEKIEKELDEKVREYVKSQGEEEISEEVEKNIKELVLSCMGKYEKAIRIPLLPTVLSAAGKIKNYLIPAVIASFAFALVLVVFIFFLQKKRKETLYFLTISAATCALIFLGAAFLAEHYEIASRLPIEASALLTLLSNFIKLLIDEILLFGIVFAGAAVLLLAIYLILSFILKDKTVKEENPEKSSSQTASPEKKNENENCKEAEPTKE